MTSNYIEIWYTVPTDMKTAPQVVRHPGARTTESLEAP